MQLRARVLTAATGAVLLSACGEFDDLKEDVAVTESAVNQTFAQHQAACQADPRVQSGVVSLTECVGADIFMKENFNGNGRTCGSCHRVERNFAIDAAFIARLPSSDPLFIAENTSDNLPLNGLEIPAQMRARGLILENVDGTQPEGPTNRFVLRSVPHNLSQGVSVTRPSFEPNPPAERTGWGGDGAPSSGTNASGVPMTGRLADFTSGAINQHFTRSLNRVVGTDFRQATEQEGQAVATFMRALGRTNEISLNAITLSDAAADAGRVAVHELDLQHLSHQRRRERPGHEPELLHQRGGREEPGARRLPAGRRLRWVRLPVAAQRDRGLTFNTPPDHRGGRLGPVLPHGHPGGRRPGGEHRQRPDHRAGGRLLQLEFHPVRRLQRDGHRERRPLPARAQRRVQHPDGQQPDHRRPQHGQRLGNVARVDRMQRRMAQMTLFELDDAVRVLSQVNLNPAQADRVRTARTRIETVVATSGTTATAFNIRMTNLANAFNDLDLADSEISANITFNIANGTRMDCADPSTDGQPGTAPCFNPALRTAAP